MFLFSFCVVVKCFVSLYVSIDFDNAKVLILCEMSKYQVLTKCEFGKAKFTAT